MADPTPDSFEEQIRAETLLRRKIDSAHTRDYMNTLATRSPTDLLGEIVVSVPFPETGRTTMTEAVTWLALDCALTPSDWQHFMRQSTIIVFNAQAGRSEPLIDENGTERLLDDPALQELTEHSRRWRRETASHRASVLQAADSVMRKAQAAIIEIRGVQAGKPHLLSVDELHLPLCFDPIKNALGFNEERAKELQSSLTRSNVPGWSDINVLAEQVRKLKDAPAQDLEPSPRERRSMLRLIATLAHMAGVDLRKPYGIAASIETAARGLGLKLSEDTIAKYLSAARDVTPDKEK